MKLKKYQITWRYFLLLLFPVLLLQACKTVYPNPTVEIKTTFGNIYVELYPDKAPVTVAAFLNYVDSGY